jgi:integrase
MAEDFTEYLCSLGLAPRTIAVYVRELRTAREWLEAHGGSLDRAPPSLIAAYADTRPGSWATRKAVRTTLSHYWTMTERVKPPLAAVRVPPKPRGHCRALEEDDTRILAKAARTRGDDPGLVVAFGLYCALRRAEIAKVRWEHFTDGDQLTVRGKSGVEATIPVHHVVLGLLTLKGWQPEGWVFPGRFDRGLTPATVWTWTLMVAKEAGVDGATVHRLRHSCLATANDNTHDLRSVQELARHSRPETTSLYTRTTKRRLRAVVDSIDY